MGSVGKSKTREIHSVFCQKCNDTHIAEYYYAEKVGFFGDTRRVSVCKKWLVENGIMLSNPRVVAILGRS